MHTSMNLCVVSVQGHATAYARHVSSSRMLAAGMRQLRLSSNSSMNRPGSSGDVVPLSMMGEARRWQPSDGATPPPLISQMRSSTHQQQQQQPYPYAPTAMPISADASAQANSYTPYSRMRSSAYAPVALPATSEMQQDPHRAAAAAEAAAAAGVAASSGSLVHVHVPFLVMFAYLGGLAACATNADWYMDCACFAGIWAALWAACCRLHPSPRTVVLLNLVPVMHMSGALGTYHWELGNLSWDILTHITNGFVGTLLFASCLADMNAAATHTLSATHSAATHRGQQEELVSAAAESPRSWVAEPSQARDSTTASTAAAAAAAPHPLHGGWRKKACSVLQLSLLLLAGTSLIEVVEAYGGAVAGQGEGIFLRGAGDFCTASLPCSEEVDTMKDMVDNVAGMMLALLALATSSSGRSTQT